ncbi:MAG: hypothetical protein HY257_04085 [Chloroflexi bacterium]|nr:hypothetical protein [Chloroflexota bacterium]
MEQILAQKVYSELHRIKETLWRIQQEIERLILLVVSDTTRLKLEDFMAIVALGASGVKDVSEKHDRYVGEAIAHEHLRRRGQFCRDGTA